MLQRIQTIYLLLVIAAIAGFLFSPVIRFEPDDARHAIDMKAYDVKFYAAGYFYFVVLIADAVAAGLALIAIFLFKKRSLQMLLCWLVLLFHTSAALYVYYFFATKETPIDIIYTAWNLIALLPVFFALLAYYNIRKDEALVKSMDRLRD